MPYLPLSYLPASYLPHSYLPLGGGAEPVLESPVSLQFRLGHGLRIEQYYAPLHIRLGHRFAVDIEAPEDDDLKTFAEALAAADGGTAAQFWHQVVIDNDAIKVSPTVLPVILPEYTEGCVLQIISAVAVSNIVVAYTNGETMVEVVLGWDDDNYDATVPWHIPGAPSLWALLDHSGYNTAVSGPMHVNGTFVNSTGGSAPIASVQGKNLALFVDNGAGGNLTGGNAANTLTITIIGVCVPV